MDRVRRDLEMQGESLAFFLSIFMYSIGYMGFLKYYLINMAKGAVLLTATHWCLFLQIAAKRYSPRLLANEPAPRPKLQRDIPHLFQLREKHGDVVDAITQFLVHDVEDGKNNG